MGDTLKLFVGGLVTIGIITALFMNGRTTVQAIGATGTAGSNLLGTAIKG
jgi:hypothetical protein